MRRANALERTAAKIVRGPKAQGRNPIAPVTTTVAAAANPAVVHEGFHQEINPAASTGSTIAHAADPTDEPNKAAWSVAAACSTTMLSGAATTAATPRRSQLMRPGGW